MLSTDLHQFCHQGCQKVLTSCHQGCRQVFNSLQNHKNSPHSNAVIIKIFMIVPNPKIMHAVPQARLWITGEKYDANIIKKFYDIPESP